jgi:GntR family transcriptional regulator
MCFYLETLPLSDCNIPNDEDVGSRFRIFRDCWSQRARLGIRRYDDGMTDAQGGTLYARVEEVLANEISDGVLHIGGQLPNEDKLIERFEVSRITVRRAIANLVRRGLVEIRRGKGTFVASPRIVQELTELSGFVEDMRAIGRKPTARVLGKDVVTASSVVAKHLHLSKGQRVVRIRRVRIADGTPVSFDETYLPMELGKKIMSNNLRHEPIFTLLEEKYKVPLIEAEYKLEAVAADETVATTLGVPEGSPIFQIERTSYTTAGKPVDYETLSYRGDLIRFVTRLARQEPSTKDQAVGPSNMRRRR